VLIPRPETELIVEAALDVFGAARHQSVAIADACTGSGNLAVALAHELECSSIVATDISADALAIGRKNAERHHVAGRVRFVRTNILDGLSGPFDLIVANPPYVARADRQALQPEVRDYEPGVALFGGASGMEIVAAVVEQGADRLRPAGYLMMEFGFGQEIDVASLVTAYPQLTLIGFRRDLQGLARIAIARRSET
jgi:release factor glutamine methyltransferase